MIGEQKGFITLGLLVLLIVKILGALASHVGSGISLEVNTALEAMLKLTSKHPEELVQLASHLTGTNLSCIYKYMTTVLFNLYIFITQVSWITWRASILKACTRLPF